MLKEAQRLKDRLIDDLKFKEAAEIRDLMSRIGDGDRATLELLDILKKSGVEVY